MIKAMDSCSHPVGNQASVRGVVLAGSHGLGGSVFENLLPRALLPVLDSPLVCYALRWLRDAGVTSTTIGANNASALLRGFLGGGNTYGLDLTYYEDLSPRGPAGCLKDAAACWPADEFVLVEGSVIPTVDLDAVLLEHRRNDAAATLVVPRGGRALEPAGVYVFSRRAVEPIGTRGYQDLKELLIPQLHAKGERVLVYPATKELPRVTDATSYLAANEWAIDGVADGELRIAGYRAHAPRQQVHRHASIAPSAQLIGPVSVGARTRIEEGAIIVGPTVLGNDCLVSRNAVVSRSVVWDDCLIGFQSRVDQSILAYAVSVPPGAVLQHGVQSGRKRLPAIQPARRWSRRASNDQTSRQHRRLAGRGGSPPTIAALEAQTSAS